MKLVLLKAHNKGYTKKNGTFVKPFDDKRPSAKPDLPETSQATKQGGLFGGWGKQVGYHAPPKPKLQPAAFHPRPGEEGEKVGIYRPHKPTDQLTWRNATEVATFVPNGDVPSSLNGVPFRAWKDHPRTDEGWDYVDGQMDDLDEPPFNLPKGKKAASGVIIEEPDGRIWLVHPTNEFAGYKATFPKGGAEDGLSLQANAIKEAFEESGLKVEITGFFGDFDRGASVARYYRAKRVGGTPTAMGWESQAVSLAPKDRLLDLLNGPSDHPVAHAAGAPEPVGAKEKPESADDWKQVNGQAGSNPGGFYEDADGTDWYCKFPQTEHHARNEILASKFYHELGIIAPDMKLIKRGGKIGVASKIIPMLMKDKDGLINGSVKGAREGFAADAWLANWDSVGLMFDNMLVDHKGRAVRIDPGGSLVFRAQGQPKGDAFGNVVGEIDSLRSGQNKQAADVFGTVTDEQIKAGVQRIAEISDARIHELVDQFGPGSAKQRMQLAVKLIARKQDLVRRFLG
jgi:ADP-ribose pyrophosphatase YjhB (NUDIX family)